MRSGRGYTSRSLLRRISACLLAPGSCSCVCVCVCVHASMCMCVGENVLVQPGCVRWDDRRISLWLFVLWEFEPHGYIILLSAYLFTCIIYLRGVCISGGERASFGS